MPSYGDVSCVGHAAIVGALTYNPLSRQREFAPIGALHEALVVLVAVIRIVAVAEGQRLIANKRSPRLARTPVQGR